MELSILVEQINKHPSCTYKVIDRSTIPFNESVTFPFQSVINSYKLVHPDKQLKFTFTLL